MAKNYADIYNSSNDAIALEQRWYVKAETTRGELIAPTDSDFLYTLGGGQIEFSQPFESSPHRSGRGHLDIIKKKKECTWSFPTYININTGVAAGTTELDQAVRTLWTSMLGKETVSSGVQFTRTVPDITFSLFECGDKFARQSRGAFVQGANMQFPGDGEATIEWSGAAKDALYLGIGKSVADNNGGNTVTLETGDGGQFKKAIGGLVMIIEANGTTRSADTPNGTPRKIVSVVGDVVTLDGAALADADGSGLNAPIYLSYYEPAAPTAINNPQTGLVGSFTIDGHDGLHCARSIGLNLQNNHELVNYCYGMDALDSPFFVPGDRMTAEVSFEMNMSKAMVAFFNDVQDFVAQTLEVILGDTATRHLDIDLPKVRFPVPSFSVPDTGSVPVTFQGTAYMTALDANDEISVYYK
jgi:hypothetical protein